MLSDARRLDVQALRGTRSATWYSSLSSTQPRLGELAAAPAAGDVALDVLDQVEAVALAVLGGVGDAVVDRLAAPSAARISLPSLKTRPEMPTP